MELVGHAGIADICYTIQHFHLDFSRSCTLWLKNEHRAFVNASTDSGVRISDPHVSIVFSALSKQF